MSLTVNVASLINQVIKALVQVFFWKSSDLFDTHISLGSATLIENQYRSVHVRLQQRNILALHF